MNSKKDQSPTDDAGGTPPAPEPKPESLKRLEGFTKRLLAVPKTDVQAGKPKPT